MRRNLRVRIDGLVYALVSILISANSTICQTSDVCKKHFWPKVELLQNSFQKTICEQTVERSGRVKIYACDCAYEYSFNDTLHNDREVKLSDISASIRVVKFYYKEFDTTKIKAVLGLSIMTFFNIFDYKNFINSMQNKLKFGTYYNFFGYEVYNDESGYVARAICVPNGIVLLQVNSTHSRTLNQCRDLIESFKITFHSD